MKKLIVFLVVLFILLSLQSIWSQPSPPTDEPIKLLWEGAKYNYITPTNDGKYIFANRIIIDPKNEDNLYSIIYQIESLSGNIIDSIMYFKEKQFVVERIAIGDNYDNLYLTTGDSKLNSVGWKKDSVYLYNLKSKTLTPIKFAYDSEHSSFSSPFVTKDNHYLYFIEECGFIQNYKRNGYIYDLKNDSIMNTTTGKGGFIFNNRGDKFYAWDIHSSQSTWLAEYNTKTGILIRYIYLNIGFTPRVVSVSTDDKYLIVSYIDSQNNGVSIIEIFNLLTESVDYKEIATKCYNPIFTDDYKYIYVWNFDESKVRILDWSTKNITWEIPILIRGEKYLFGDLIVTYSSKLKVYKIYKEFLDVQNSLPSGITINYTNNGNSNYKLLINSNKNLNFNFNFNFEILNLSGVIFHKELVYISEGENTIEGNISTFPSGIYLINLKSDNLNKTIKIIKE